MISVIIFYFLGILSSLFFAFLPSYFLSGCILLSTFLISWYISFFHIFYAKSILAFGIGICWVFVYSHLILTKKLPTELEGSLVRVVGYVASIPFHNNLGNSFNFKIQTINNKKANFLVRLNWQDKQISLHPGEQWQLWVKLKRLHSLRNPGTFDSEQLALYHHIRAQGYVKPNQENKLLKKTNHFLIMQAREYLQKKLISSLKNNPFQGIFLALVIGDTSLITQVQWETFRNTGTSHLLAISGLHIGFFAGLIGKLVGFGWRYLGNLSLRFPAPKIGAIAGIIAAFFYGALAGFSVSTQRALIMISILLSTQFILNRNVPLILSFLIALGFMTLINPLDILSMGFWLSFLAVASLMYGCGFRIKTSNLLWRLVKPQYSVGLGMLPISLFFFQQYSLFTSIANVIAIPVISFLVIPPILFGTMLLLINGSLGTCLLSVGNFFLKIAWIFLQTIAAHHEFIIHKAVRNGWILLAFTIAILLLMMPRGMPPRWLALYWMLPLFLGMPSKLHPQEIKLAVLDVGQGLAVLIRTRTHNLLYDTGAKLTDNFDMGKAVVVPYLIYENIKKLDLLMISHGDNDHIGGANSILGVIPVTKIITSVPERFKSSFIPVAMCHQGMKWQWDGVYFEILHPASGYYAKGNNASCVLKITSGKQSILLTGDIEKPVEKNLLQDFSSQLPSTVLVVPHHGSRTSSTKSFLEAIHPKYSIISCGYRNRYRHPHPLVCQHYQEIRSNLLNTTTSGAIIMTLGPGSDIVVTEYRKQYHRFWHIF